MAMWMDDTARRDQRLYDLSKLMGWSERETFGCLYDLWEMCRDRLSEVIPKKMVAARALREAPSGTPTNLDVVGNLILAGYAKQHRSPIMITMVDAVKMISYLKHQRASGRRGGIKSAAKREAAR